MNNKEIKEGDIIFNGITYFKIIKIYNKMLKLEVLNYIIIRTDENCDYIKPTDSANEIVNKRKIGFIYTKYNNEELPIIRQKRVIKKIDNI